MEPNSPRPIPLWRTVALSLIATVRYFDYYLQVSWAWILVTFPFLVAANWLIFPFNVGDPRHRTTSRLVTAALTDIVLMLPLIASAAVAWHRFIITGYHNGPTMRFDLSRRTRRYMVVALAFQLLSLGPIFIGLGLRETGAIATALFLSFIGFAVASQLSLLLPAVALDRHGADVIWARIAARGNEVRLLAGFVLTGFAGSAVVHALGGLIDAFVPTVGPVGTAIYNAFRTLWSKPLEILPPLAFLSLAYRHIVESRGSTTV